MLLNRRYSIKTAGAGAMLVLSVALLSSPMNATSASPSPTPSPSPCTTKSAAPLVSPDKAFNAVVRENACESGYAFMATSNWTVDVVSQTNPSSKLTVFSFDDDGNPNTRPKLAWTANETLTITYLTAAGVGIKKSSFSTVTVLYKYQHT